MNKNEISFLIGLFVENGHLEISDLEDMGLNVSELMKHETGIHEYEGNHDLLKDFKMKIVKKLYQQFNK